MEIDEPGPDVEPHQLTDLPETFVAQSRLEKGISNQHETSPQLAPFQCSECFTSKQLTKVYSTKNSLKDHIRRSHVHGEPGFKCQVCFKAFHRSCSLKLHNQIHLNLEKQIKCDLCSTTFQTKQSLQKHLFRVHKKKTGGVKYLKCEFCAREFLEINKLENHVVAEHVVDKEFPCPVCNKTFIDAETLEKHMMGHDKQETFVCDLCSIEYTHIISLRNHLKLKHAKFFYCYKCHRSFSNKQEFDQLNLNSEIELQFKCEICIEIFHSQCNLDIHTNFHLKEIKITKKEEPEIKCSPKNDRIGEKVEKLMPKSTKELQCDLCLQTFDRESYFRKHRILAHLNAIWKCNFQQCSKSYKQYHQLTKHKLTHSAGRTFKCPICPQFLTSPKKVEAHVAGKHGSLSSFKCPFKDCRTSWTNNSLLQVHLMSHQTAKLFKCSVCTEDKSFKHFFSLKRHYRREHSMFDISTGTGPGPRKKPAIS